MTGFITKNLYQYVDIWRRQQFFWVGFNRPCIASRICHQQKIKIIAIITDNKFSNHIRNFPIDGEIWCHFSVEKHFFRWSLNIIKDYTNNIDQFAGKTSIPQDKFLDLVHLVLTTTWYTFNSHFYWQTNGVVLRRLAPGESSEWLLS